MRLFSVPTRPVFWWGCVAIWFATLYVLSSQSALPSPNISFSDKIAHFCYFALGSTAFYLGLRFYKPKMAAIRAAFATVIFAGLVGWFDEWHQTFVPGRSGNDIGDWIADLAGGIFACFVGGFLFHWIQNRAKDGAETPN